MYQEKGSASAKKQTALDEENDEVDLRHSMHLREKEFYGDDSSGEQDIDGEEIVV
jgi:hypothetical protein